jgi:hypothetical protein
VYKGCKSAPREFQELSGELSSLYTILHELEDEAKTPTSLLNRHGAWKPELDALLQNLSTTLEKVEDIVKRYHSLGRDQKKTWDRVKFATKELGGLRSKLQIHVTGINLFISSLSDGSLGRIEVMLEELVQDIKAGRKEPSIVSTYEDNDELAWDELERELIVDGITREDVRRHKEEIREYLRRLIGESIDDINHSDSWSSPSDVPSPSHCSIQHDPAELEPTSSGSHQSSAILRINTSESERTFGEVERSSLESRQSLVILRTNGFEYPKSFATVLSSFLDRTNPETHASKWVSSRPSKSTTDALRAKVNEVAFSETLNYRLYPRLGFAASLTCIRTLPLTSLLCVLKTSASEKRLMERIRGAMSLETRLKPDNHLTYMKIPGGFRCRFFGGPVLECFLMVVKLPLTRQYGIIFQDMKRRSKVAKNVPIVILEGLKVKGFR